ncbi:hypothetical protein PVAP13_5NG012320 [Panicum virgatum]|uniref:Uncharacterized protein n=1 Tax=Panicum virgatum TaxID=38727 RepID=A0A8T0S8N3_PANVG|nr:hypothetical protein PVAP13_5NG012320 [Panicum virgatum]
MIHADNFNLNIEIDLDYWMLFRRSRSTKKWASVIATMETKNQLTIIGLRNGRSHGKKTLQTRNTKGDN